MTPYDQFFLLGHQDLAEEARKVAVIIAQVEAPVVPPAVR
jgi:hypothetical protein